MPKLTDSQRILLCQTLLDVSLPIVKDHLFVTLRGDLPLELVFIAKENGIELVKTNSPIVIELHEKAYWIDVERLSDLDTVYDLFKQKVVKEL